MSLDAEYLQYPHRHHGMDHDRYDWSMLSDRPPVRWPGSAGVAVWINVSVQFFPLNQRGEPFPPPGGMTMPYPDLRHFSLRDYGNRVGIFRVLDALKHFDFKASFAVNGQLAERLPSLVESLADRGEIIAHGWNMDTPHYGGQDMKQEREVIERTVTALRARSGQAVRGWLSPGRNESENTPDLLGEAGIDYFCDWVNDDMPYPFRTRSGHLLALPLSTELEDQFVIQSNLHSEQSWVEQVCDAFDLLSVEAAQEGGRLLALSIHPWLMGQPHRIGKLEAALDYIARQSGAWSATPEDIVEGVQSGRID